MPDFSRFDKRCRGAGSSESIRIYPGQRNSYITVAAVEAHFTSQGELVETVAYHIDRDQSVLALNPGEDGPHAYSVHECGGGALISLRGTLAEAFDVDVAALEETWALPLERDDETGYVVCDVAPLVEAVGAGVHCEECGKRCTAGKSLENHRTHVHGTTAEDLVGLAEDDDVPDGDDSWQDIGGDEADA